MVLYGCQSPKTTLISGGKCRSAGFSSYPGLQMKLRLLKIWMSSTKRLSRKRMQSQSVLTLSRFRNEMLLVVNNHLFSSILVEVCKLCHQCLPFLLLFRHSFSARIANTLTADMVNSPQISIYLDGGDVYFIVNENKDDPI